VSDLALAALRTAARQHAMSRGDVKAKSLEVTGKEKWSELTLDERWTLVCSIEPRTYGPYGHSMEQF
jgi:hypothetical protein